MHRRSFASEGTLPKATRRARKRVRGNAEGRPTEYLKTSFDSCYHFPWCRSLLHPTLLNGLRDGKGEKFAKTMLVTDRQDVV
ncbi:MAG: hypothetical protein IJI54_01590 [Kiritimatiellae bacterium]|nr:hypothetical protein [Kiritimatiellia bacterium]